MAFNFRKFIEGIRIVPKSTLTTTDVQKGDLQVKDDADGKLYYNNGSSSSSPGSPVVTEEYAAQGTSRLKNKDLEDSSVAIVDATDTTKKIKFDAAGTASTSTTITSSQTANRVLTLPDATDTLVGETKSATLTNKTIAAGSNTISGLTNSNLSGSAAISNANLATMASSSTTVGTVKGNISGSSAVPSDVVLTSDNTSSSAVYRDSSGNFSAGTITASLSGNATNVTGTVAIANGGTGQTTQTAAFDALAPTTTAGDIIVRGSSGNTRLDSSSVINGYVLTKNSSAPNNVEWAAPTGVGGVPIGSIVAFSGGYFTGTANAGTYTNVLGNTVASVNSYISSAGFVVCDGTAPNDPLSPIFNANTRYLPDLTDNRFLQGSTSAGGLGGANSFQISTSNLPNISLTISGTATNNTAVVSTAAVASSNHTHSPNTLEARIRIATGSTSIQELLNDPASAGNWSATVRNDFASNSVSSSTSISTATDLQGTTTTPSSTTTVALSGNVPQHQHALSGTASGTFLNTAIENRPLYLNVFYIIRIK